MSKESPPFAISFTVLKSALSLLKIIEGTGNLQRRLFSLKIDQYNCRNLKSEMEVTKTKSVTDRNGATMVVKEKTGDKLPTARLPKESTNLTDAFKYLMMRKEWLRVWQSKGTAYIG